MVPVTSAVKFSVYALGLAAVPAPAALMAAIAAVKFAALAMLYVVPAGGGTVTVTVAVLLLVGSNMEVALTVRGDFVSPAATLRTPEASIVLMLPLVVIDQATVLYWLSAGPFTVAVKGWVLPLSTLIVWGLTVTLLTVGVGVPEAATWYDAALVLLPEYPARLTVTVRYLSSSSVAGE